MLSIQVVYCAIVLLVSNHHVLAQNRCINPDGRQGECIGIKQCPPLISIVSKSPISPTDREFIQKSACGGTAVASNPNVCCETNNYVAVRSNLLPDTQTCGQSTQDKIIGGVSADLGEFPWLALLQYTRSNGDKTFECGGTLISDRYVITAAHCMVGLPRGFRLTAVRLGEYDTSKNRDCVVVGANNLQECSPDVIDVGIEETIPHEIFSSRDKNTFGDIALIRLSRSVSFTQYISPICMPMNVEELKKDYIGEKLTVAGWGIADDRKASDILQKLTVPVVTKGACSTRYNPLKVIRSNQMCAGGERGKDSCSGDSGGPLMSYSSSANGNINYYLAGVVSYGPTPCGMQGWPGVYTRVNSYMDWVVSKMR